MQYVLWHKNPDTDSFCSAIVYTQYLRDQWEEAIAIALGKPNFETKYILERANISCPEVKTKLPEWAKIILMDHNEASQSIDNRERYIIKWVIDHHKVADFTTWYPLMMRLEPVGCTCTILAKIFQENDYIPSKEMAFLMVSAIISDSLYFRSPTTTEQDKKAVNILAPLAWITDIETYALEMFAAKSDLWDTPVEDIIRMDYKTFDFHGHFCAIAVSETTSPDYLLGRKEELLEAIEKVKASDGVEHLLFCVVDILKEQTTAIVLDDSLKIIVEKAFNTTVINHEADLWARVSRKKQIAPVLDKYFSQ